MSLWKCYNCVPRTGPAGVDFVADKPVCPGCGLDGDTPIGATKIAPRVAIHFDPPHPIVRGSGTNLAACDGKPIMGRHGTGDPVAVSCPACLESDQFLKANGVSGTVNLLNDWSPQ